MPEMDLPLPEIGDLSSDTDDGDVELFLPGNSTAVPEAAIEALLAKETATDELLTIFLGATEQVAGCNQLPPTVKASFLPQVQTNSRSAHTSTDVDHAAADQQTAGQIVLQEIFSRSRSSTEALAVEMYQAAQVVHAALAAQPQGCNNSSGVDMLKAVATRARLSTPAATTAGATLECPAAAAATDATHYCCEPSSSSELTSAAPLVCSSSGCRVAEPSDSSSGSSLENAGAAHDSSSSSSGDRLSARHIVLSADGMLDDLDLDDLLLRLSLGQQQQQQVGSSSSSSSGSQPPPLAAADCMIDSVTQGSSSDMARFAGRAPEAARGAAAKDAAHVSPELLVSTLPHKYSSYQPRWAKQQQQQQQPQQQDGQPLPAYGSWKLCSSSCTAGKLSNSTSSSRSSSSKFCGPVGSMSPEKERLWLPLPRSTITVDLRREANSLVGAQTPATAAAATGGPGLSGQTNSSRAAWGSNGNSSTASDSDSSEEDWRLFRQQVCRPAASLAQQQQQ